MKLQRRAVFILEHSRRHENGCLLYVGKTETGLKRERACLSVEGKQEQAYRIIWKSVNGEIPATKYVLPRCGNGDCVEITHLYLGTQVENARDSQLHGVFHKSAIGVMGISFQKGRKRFVVMDYTVNKCLYQGKDFFEACCARKSWENSRKTVE